MSAVDVLADSMRTAIRRAGGFTHLASTETGRETIITICANEARAAVVELMEAHDELLRLAEQLWPFLPEIVKQRSKAALARCKGEV